MSPEVTPPFFRFQGQFAPNIVIRGCHFPTLPNSLPSFHFLGPEPLTFSFFILASRAPSDIDILPRCPATLLHCV